MNVILLGPPGAGKGTQSEIISKKFDLKHISTGDFFRKAIHEGTELGKKAKQYLDQGTLVPDEVAVALIRESLPSTHGFLLDGFPRTLSQAKILDSILGQEERQLDCVINLVVDRKEIMKRMLKRGRSDDQLETIQKRLEVYEQETRPLISYYQTQGKLKNVDGVQNIENVSQAIQSHLETKKV